MAQALRAWASVARAPHSPRSAQLYLASVATNGVATSHIWRASSRVGERIRAPACARFRGSPSRRSISTMGTTNARVLPEPVLASTATSLLFRNSGMVTSCRHESLSVTESNKTPSLGQSRCSLSQTSGSQSQAPHLHRRGLHKAMGGEHVERLGREPRDVAEAHAALCGHRFRLLHPATRYIFPGRRRGLPK